MTAAAAPSALDSLKSTLRSVWRFGSVSLVGWTPTGNGIEVLAVPVTRLFEHVHLHRRLLKGDRQMGRKTFDDVAAHLGMQPIEIRLDAAIEPAAIEAAVRATDVEPGNLNADIHASADYRRAMIPVFTRRALNGAMARA